MYAIRSYYESAACMSRPFLTRWMCSGERVRFQRTDVSSAADMKALVALAIEQFGGLVITSYSIHYTKLYDGKFRI